jgi:hypothetical protein
MFPSRYFPDRYFAPRYWPKVGDVSAPFGLNDLFIVPAEDRVFIVPNEGDEVEA